VLNRLAVALSQRVRWQLKHGVPGKDPQSALELKASDQTSVRVCLPGRNAVKGSLLLLVP